MEEQLTTLVATTLQSELLIFVIVSIIFFIFKDFATNFASGLAFKMSKDFNEGDLVLIDGEPAVIIDIGIRQTKFQHIRDGKLVWRFVYNTRIPHMNISKVIDNGIIED